MKSRVYFGMASAAVVALVVALNLTGNINKNNIAKATVQTNKVVLGDKAKTSEPPIVSKQDSDKSQVEVPINLEVEKGDQKNADAGSSPWKLDPVFVSQVFVSLEISPNGIVGDYPVKEDELKVGKSTEDEAVVEVSSSKTTINRVYLKRLIKQDNTGIWTVVGYDLAS